MHPWCFLGRICAGKSPVLYPLPEPSLLWSANAHDVGSSEGSNVNVIVLLFSCTSTVIEYDWHGCLQLYMSDKEQARRLPETPATNHTWPNGSIPSSDVRCPSDRATSGINWPNGSYYHWKSLVPTIEIHWTWLSLRTKVQIHPMLLCLVPIGGPVIEPPVARKCLVQRLLPVRLTIIVTRSSSRLGSIQSDMAQCYLY